jgi:hypothetical protein
MVCNGGDAESVTDDTDTPGAANDCVTGTCNNGAPESQPVASGAACNGGVCNGSGACVECLNDGHCPQEAPSCDTGSNVCVSAECTDGNQNGDETDTDCGGMVCAPCAAGLDCLVDTDCESGSCGGDMTCDKEQVGAQCAADGDCESGQCEDGVCCATTCNGLCESCNVAGTEGQCVDIPSGSDPDNECAGGAVCDAGVCKKPAGDTCGNAGECSSGFCANGVCCNAACTAMCEACNVTGSEGMCVNVPNGQDPGNDCTGGQVCDGNGACVPGPNGATCAMAAECMSNFCVDGVCCNEACGGTCRACDLNGTEGTCGFVPDGTDPDNECQGGNPDCNGAGMCN